MIVVAISSPDEAPTLLRECQELGYVAFVYHHADPEHKLLRDKFLYVHDDAELTEKIKLLKSDSTVKDMIQ